MAIGRLPPSSALHSQKATAGTRRRRSAQARRNTPLAATVTARALVGSRAPFSALAQRGRSPQRSGSRCRSPVSGWRRTTGAVWDGATFRDGARFGSGPAVRNSSRIASAGMVWT